MSTTERDICGVCQTATIIYDDTDVKGYVCTKCGTVWNGSVIADDVLEFNRDSRCPNGLLIDQVTGEKGGLAISRPGMNRNYSVGQHDADAQRDRRVIAAHRRLAEQIRIVMNNLKIPNHLFGMIKDLTLRAVEKEITKQKKVDTTIAVCTYIVCRQQNQPIQLIDAADTVDMNVFKLGSHYKRISKDLGIKLEAQDPSILTEKVLADLKDDLSSLSSTELMKVMDQTSRLVQEACKEWLGTGRKPISIVAAAVKIVVSCSNINLNINEVAKQIGVGSLSIRDRHREMVNMIIKLAAPLPWAKEINKKNLPDYLPFLLQYMESLRELAKISAKKALETKEEEDQVEEVNAQPTTPQTLPLQMDQSTTIKQEPTSTEPLFVSRKRRSQKRDVEQILVTSSESAPPSFVRSQLEKQNRIRKIVRAKKRIQNLEDGEELDDQDVAIEQLLKAGSNEQRLEEGYFHMAVPIPDRQILESEEITGNELTDLELARYIKTEEQVEIEIQLRNKLGDDIDGEISTRRAKKKARYQ